VTHAVSHLGICVSDLDASLRFWCDGLGFSEVASHEVGPEFGALMELDDVGLVSRMINRDGLTIELLAFASPPVIGSRQRRPMNQLGFTHLSLRVSDLEAMADAIEAAGGQVVRTTRTSLDVGGMDLDFVFCTDPDGVRIELMDLGS